MDDLKTVMAENAILKETLSFIAKDHPTSSTVAVGYQDIARGTLAALEAAKEVDIANPDPMINGMTIAQRNMLRPWRPYDLQQIAPI